MYLKNNIFTKGCESDFIASSSSSLPGDVLHNSSLQFPAATVPGGFSFHNNITKSLQNSTKNSLQAKGTEASLTSSEDKEDSLEDKGVDEENDQIEVEEHIEPNSSSESGIDLTKNEPSNVLSLFGKFFKFKVQLSLQ